MKSSMRSWRVIYQAVDEGFEGLVMNPAGFTYAGFALKDCLKGAGLPYIEVHISNIATGTIWGPLALPLLYGRASIAK
jgi:3-dehydroquinate dehydratase